jgi:hypothetical protein
MATFLRKIKLKTTAPIAKLTTATPINRPTLPEPSASGSGNAAMAHVIPMSIMKTLP